MLSGKNVSLVPLSFEHLPALLRIATDPRERYDFTSVPKTEEGLRGYIARALSECERGVALPFATCRSHTGEVLGSTRFAAIERWVFSDVPVEDPREIDAVEIGWTWLTPDAQRTHVNTEAKFLMLTHAFEHWKVRRVTLKTDRRNERSRAAILRLGFHFDGVLRAHSPGWDGKARDTAFFSLLDSEWPTVRTNLTNRLKHP
jgi:N-acetyltransferase